MAHPINWTAIGNDPRFQRLHRRKAAFLVRMMVFALSFYFLLPLGAAYFTDIFRLRIFGAINVGVLFALSEFVVAWGLAYYYSVRAREFDGMALELARDAARIGTRS